MVINYVSAINAVRDMVQRKSVVYVCVCTYVHVCMHLRVPVTSLVEGRKWRYQWSTRNHKWSFNQPCSSSGFTRKRICLFILQKGIPLLHFFCVCGVSRVSPQSFSSPAFFNTNRDGSHQLGAQSLQAGTGQARGLCPLMAFVTSPPYRCYRCPYSVDEETGSLGEGSFARSHRV